MTKPAQTKRTTKMPARPRAKMPRLSTDDHLAALHVDNFKSLRDVRVELGQVNVFVGANGAGKSSLLEAVGILGACAAGTVDDQALLRRGVRPGVPELYRSSFEGEGKKPRIALDATSRGTAQYYVSLDVPKKAASSGWRFGNERVAVGGEMIAGRLDTVFAGHWPAFPTPDRSITTAVRADLAADARARDFFTALDAFGIFAPVTPVLRAVAPDPAPRSPVGLSGGQLAEAVGQLAAQRTGKVALTRALALIDWADQVRAGEPSRAFLSPSVPASRSVVEFRDRFMAKRRNVLSGYDASEGALYILFMLVLAAHTDAPAILAVDNFDQALNPRTARALTRLFVESVIENGRQVLLTTHNPLVLDGLDLGDDRIRLFAVSRDKVGHTRVHRVPVRDFAALKEKHGEHAVSRLWIEGRLGGMPDDV